MLRLRMIDRASSICGIAPKLVNSSKSKAGGYLNFLLESDKSRMKMKIKDAIGFRYYLREGTEI